MPTPNYKEGNRHRHLLLVVFLTTVVLGLLGCAGAATAPEPTQTGPPTQPAPVATEAPTHTPAPTATSTPPPTREPFACATPYHGDPPLTTFPESRQDTPLMQVLERMPLAFKEEGVWFNDRLRVEEINGGPHPRSLGDLQAMPEEEFEQYFREYSRGLAVDRPSMLQRAWQEAESWQALFGFDGLVTDRYLGTGHSGGGPPPRQLSYLEGPINAEVIRNRLAALGYQVCATEGEAYYAIRHDNDQSRDPAQRFVLSTMNRVVLGADFLVAAPDSDRIEQSLAVPAGVAPAMTEDPAVIAVAEALGDPASAALLTPEVTFRQLDNVAHNPPPPVQMPKPEEWGTLHQWKYLGAGYTLEEGEHLWKFVLYYPDPAAAEADVEELSNRIETYDPSYARENLPLNQESFSGDICDSLVYIVSELDAGSTLTVQCSLEDNSRVGLLWSAMEVRDLGFLLP